MAERAVEPLFSGFVYFVQMGRAGPIKIGYSTNPAARIASMQTSNARELVLIGSIPGDTAVERAIHRELSAYRLRGEWWRPEPAVMRYVRKLLRHGSPWPPHVTGPRMPRPSEPRPQIDPVARALAIAKTLSDADRQRRKERREQAERECAEWRKARNG